MLLLPMSHLQFPVSPKAVASILGLQLSHCIFVKLTPFSSLSLSAMLVDCCRCIITAPLPEQCQVDSHHHPTIIVCHCHHHPPIVLLLFVATSSLMFDASTKLPSPSCAAIITIAILSHCASSCSCHEATISHMVAMCCWLPQLPIPSLQALH